ncbi:flavin reductase family protein [Dokdonia donghaensis]|uniref:Flavin reductase n=1 Tax=Dokdonia donghaensis DSW-1 TaxID=1300343 RepID=A0A0A2GXE7_9FLAO|nr:flavin reductase family protein [Dokdonia donghaensis]ANH59651.1 Flavin reductase like domain protein [Dokdonia donghaensis DSW-1]KGO07006.1 flavin reductase [Dokdonia donghaensis DSW-1]
MLTIDPKDIPVSQLFGHLTGAVGPRPIAFASTVDKDGNVNLAPFSFFNVFGANPPILVYSPSRSGRDNTTKNTLDNVLEVAECTVNMVNYAMVQQMSLASTAYAKGVNEFVKAGLTELASEKVTPPRVAESPVQFECKVIEVKALGDQGGAGNLVICEILKMHIDKIILTDAGAIDPLKIDQVSRMGANWYSRAKEGLFEVPKPVLRTGIGVDQIPENIRLSDILTGNDLGMLGNVEQLPTQAQIDTFIASDAHIKELVKTGDDLVIHKKAQELLAQKNVNNAWKILLAKR